MRLLVAAFRDTIASATASHMKVTATVKLLESSKAELEDVVAVTDFSKYDFVLILGEYNGRDQGELRIETRCSSAFRNDKQGKELFAIPYFLRPEQPFKLAYGIGNSWCNLLCYLIARNIPGKPFTFVHIPKTFGARVAAEALDTQLAAIRQD